MKRFKSFKFDAITVKLRIAKVNPYAMFRPVFDYEMYDNGILIFSGSDFGSVCTNGRPEKEHAIGLMAFLSLKDGDTDPEYFAKYTPEQIAWRDARAEEVQCIMSEFDN
jgi:hypothetical protein